MSDLWLGTYWLKIAAGYEFGTLKLADVFDLWLVTLLFEVFEIVFGKVKLTDVFDRWLMTVYTRAPTSQAKPSIVGFVVDDFTRKTKRSSVAKAAAH